MGVCCCNSVVPSMMAKWLDDNALLLTKTGVDRDELRFIWSIMRDKLVTHYETYHDRGTVLLSPFASLLITLHWMKHYPTESHLSTELGVSQSTIKEHLRHTIHSLYLTLVPHCLAHSPMPSRVYKSSNVVGARLVVDSTFINLPHQHDSDDRKRSYYSKASTKQALKFQLCTTTSGDVFHLSSVVVGSVADITLLRQSGLLDLLSGDTLLLGDKGYQGESQIITPHKKPRGGEITDEEKEENKMIYSKRVVVENSIHQLKQWQVIGSVYRGEWKSDEDLQHVTEIVQVIGAIVKRHITTHPVRAQPKATP